jgi:hypothetical protein
MSDEITLCTLDPVFPNEGKCDAVRPSCWEL